MPPAAYFLVPAYLFSSYYVKPFCKTELPDARGQMPGKVSFKLPFWLSALLRKHAVGAAIGRPQPANAFKFHLSRFPAALQPRAGGQWPPLQCDIWRKPITGIRICKNVARAISPQIRQAGAHRAGRLPALQPHKFEFCEPACTQPRRPWPPGLRCV